MPRSAEPDPLDDFHREPFTHGGTTKDVYWAGEGPGVLVMTEVPQITPFVAGFARLVRDRGFTVAMPDLLGDAGEPAGWGDFAQASLHLCVSREFTLFARGRTSPIIQWLRPLGRELHRRAGGPGIGAVGMCLTGGFALALSVDDHLVAPVLSQPSLPFGPWNAADLGLPSDDLTTVKDRCAAEDLCILGVRFEGDWMAPEKRFRRLEAEFGHHFVGIRIPDEAAHPGNRPLPPHSVLTADLVDEPGEPTFEAREKVLDLFAHRLQQGGTGRPPSLA